MFVKSNLCDKPLKLLIDTGAGLSLISKNALKEGTYKKDFQINLYGLIGKEISIQTEGITYAILNMGGQFLDTTFHIIEEEYTGPGDGYLGFDFLSLYKTKIDLEKMKICIKIEDLIKTTIEPQKKDGKYGGKKYLRACAFHSRKIEEKAEMKIHTVMPMSKLQSSKNTRNFTRVERIFEKLNLEHCSEKEKKFISQICDDFPHQFYLEGDILGSTDIIKHHIKLIPNSRPVNVRQYRIPETQGRIMNEIIQDYEYQGLIEKCHSHYNSPAILVRKKDGLGSNNDYRFVVDYRKLNEITEISNFPIPYIDDIFNDLNGCEYFTTLDVKGAFHQIFVDEDCRDLTAFTANNSKYRWIRMPMGLAAAPLTWQRAVTILFEKIIGRGLHIYLDDCIIYAKSKEEHDKLLIYVMKTLKIHNIQLKISNCIFYAREFEYLGHIISKMGIKANTRKIEIIKNYPRPNTVKAVQSFLGLCSYFRRYVNFFSQISKPLTALLKKERPFVWTEQQQESLEKLQRALADDVMLSFPNFEDIFYVTTDASNVAIGAMLSQGEPPSDRPIYFYSKTLTDTQKRYSTIERELLAIVEAIKAFRVYLYGRFFVLITDHRALCYLFNLKDCGSRLFRQKLELSNYYNFKILYRPGAQNRVAKSEYDGNRENGGLFRHDSPAGSKQN